MEDGFPGSLAVEGRTLRVAVARKRVRNLNARLRDGTLHVSAPLRATRAWILESIPDLARVLILRERRRDLNREGAALAVARRVAARLPDPPAVDAVEFTPRPTSCWGTYSLRTRTVRLSAALRHMPPSVLEGVVAHELCHTRYRGHGPRFRALLRRVDPDTDRVRGFLDGAQWFAREGARIPPTDRGPLLGPEPAAAPDDEPHPGAGKGSPRVTEQLTLFGE